MLNRSFISLSLAAAFALLATIARADVVETKDGARLVGKITKVDGVTITLKTEYAGDIAIKQGHVVALTTDEPRYVRLADGTVAEGTVTPAPEGKVQINDTGGAVATPVDKVIATWSQGERDPALVALAPNWSFEVAADMTGKSGNSDQFGTALSARAKRVAGPETLQFYTGYNYQSTEGETSDDRFKIGFDYADNFSGRKSWYARDEAGYDHVKDISFYNVAAVGLGYDLIKKPRQILTGRTGLAYRYETYGDPTAEDVSSLGLDLGLHHEYTFRDSKMVNDLTYVPAFDDFNNYRAVHESYFEMPLANPKWKLRLGVTNEYTSQPSDDVEKLDTTYFVRFVLSQK